MPFLGAHTSVAGGLYKAFERMKRIGGEALQIFTRNQRQWKATPLGQEEIDSFRKMLLRHGTPFVASHSSYLINLGTWKEELAKRSVKALSEELQRCFLLGIPWIVIHPGSHGGRGVDEGIANIVTNLDSAIRLAGDDNQVGILLETVAGQGTSIGGKFEELAEIMDRSDFGQRLGVCVDTCHIFAAGYDIREEDAYMETVDMLDEIIGLENVRLFHLNDSKKELGSKIDRHEHIGKGQIGLSGFANLLNDTRFRNHPMVLETPKGKEMLEDIENLKVLRSLLKK